MCHCSSSPFVFAFALPVASSILFVVACRCLPIHFVPASFWHLSPSVVPARPVSDFASQVYRLAALASSSVRSFGYESFQSLAGIAHTDLPEFSFHQYIILLSCCSPLLTQYVCYPFL